MSFRDISARTANPVRAYTDGGALRDMNFSPVKVPPEETEPEIKTAPEKAQPPQYTAPVTHYHNTPPQSVPVQSMPLPAQRMRPPQSVCIPAKTENQFLYYTQNTSAPAPARPPVTPPPVPPRPPEPVKPDPSKFVEERTETPPPKMVRVAVPVRKKVDNTNNDFGAFGTTFDGDPEQSTMITEIPVMNNIDDFKI